MKFRLFKIHFEISYLILSVLSISIIAGYFKKLFLCFSAVIVHETGHLIPMCLFGYKPEKIKISMFEITITDTLRLRRKSFQNFFIILSGPFANFICFILYYLLYLYRNDFFMPIAIANLSVGLFNLMPVLSLDGGQLLYIFLCRRFSERNAERVVDIFTILFIFPLFALGFLLLFKSKYNFSLLFICVYLIFALILKNNKYF